jgi:hypothetical protein
LRFFVYRIIRKNLPLFLISNLKDLVRDEKDS